MDAHGLSTKKDTPRAESDSQVTGDTSSNTSSSKSSNRSFQADLQGLGSWAQKTESRFTHQKASVVSSRVASEHSPHITLQPFNSRSELENPSFSNSTGGSATDSQFHCRWSGCAFQPPFKDRATLKWHIESHKREATDSPKLHCSYAGCDKSFMWKFNLDAHSRVHDEANEREPHRRDDNKPNADVPQGDEESFSKQLATAHSPAEWEHDVFQGDLDEPIQDNKERPTTTGGEAIHGEPTSSGLKDHYMQRLHESRSRSETHNPPSSETHSGMHLQDSSIGRLMETEFTLLPKSSPHTTQIVKRQKRNLDHLLNPTAYYEKLNRLELDTAAICGLDSGPPDAHSQRDFRDGFQKVHSALKHLQTEEFCGHMMSILIEDPGQPNVARTIHICPQDLDTTRTSYSTLVDEILHEICGDKRSLGKSLQSQENSRYCFLATTLLVGVVSFSGSHVCSFDVNLWSGSVSEIPVGFGFSFRRRDLACLKDFVGGPAWVLGRSRAKSEEVELKISLTVQDFQELWGPIWLVGGTRENGSIIRTERGFVVPLPRPQQSDVTGREVECHWTTTCPQYADALDPLMLSNTSRMLIGTTFGLTINPECHNQIGDIQDYFSNQLQLPGACNHYYVTEGYDVQLVGGQYVTGGIVGKRKRIPATTLKAALISEIQDPELDVTPLLKLNIGLEISPCTGNARRSSLWHALYLSQKPQRPQLTDCNHDFGSVECIEQCWKQSCSTRSLPSVRCFDCGVATTTTAPLAAINSKNDICNNVVARSRIVSAIMALQHTGLDPEGNLQAYWPFVKNRMTRRIQPTRFSKWFNIIADTRDGATFAVASHHCLEFQGDRSLACSPNGYRDPLQKTCLSIRLAQQSVTVTEGGFRQHLGLLTPPPSLVLLNCRLVLHSLWQGRICM